MTENVDTVEVSVTERRNGEKQLAAQGWGWPHYEETAEGNESFLSAMEQVKERVDLSEHDKGDVVATFDVRRPDAVVTDIEVDQ